MATLNIHGHDYHYEEHGSKKGPALVLSPLLYTDTSVYEPLVNILADDYRVITYDHRGSGRSDKEVSPSLERSVWDVAALIEKLNLGPCHFIGNCLGASVGLQLAISRSDLLKSCILMGTVAEADSEETIRDMESFLNKAKSEGMRAVIEPYAEIIFGPTFRASRDPVQVMRREKWLHHISQIKPEEIDEALQIFHRKDVTKDLIRIQCDVLVLAGTEDSPTNLEAYSRLVKGIPGAEYKVIHHAGYSLAIEQPEEVAEIIETFIGKVERRWAENQKQSPLDWGTQAS